MKLACITDVHGYLNRSLEALEAVEDEIGENLLRDDQWDSDYKLIFNGDAFDRGPKNRKTFEWVIDNADVYNIGNHEFLALFPDVGAKFLSDEYMQKADKDDLYWREMEEEIRVELMEGIVSGNITAAHREHEFAYTHAGIEDPDVENLNRQLQEAGERLFEGYRAGKERYQKAQEEIVWIEETSEGTEIQSEYRELFSARREPESIDGGILWKRFNQLETEVPQVVGHTTGKYLRQKGYSDTPQKKGGAININTIRDSFETGKVAISLEDQTGIEIYEIEI